MTNQTSVSWTNRWTFILAATGSAVGLGNITGEYGGGAFVLVYLGCILLIGVPVMVAEVMTGRAARANPFDAMLTLSRDADATPLWALVGLAVVGELLGDFENGI